MGADEKTNDADDMTDAIIDQPGWVAIGSDTELLNFHSKRPDLVTPCIDAATGNLNGDWAWLDTQDRWHLVGSLREAIDKARALWVIDHLLERERTLQ